MKKNLKSKQIHTYRIVIAIIIIIVSVIHRNHPNMVYSNIFFLLGGIFYIIGQVFSHKKKDAIFEKYSTFGSLMLILGVIIPTGWYKSPFLFLLLVPPFNWMLAVGGEEISFLKVLYLPLMIVLICAAMSEAAWEWLFYVMTIGVICYAEIEILRKWDKSSKKEIEALKEKASRDPLTGLFNRYVLEELYERIGSDLFKEVCSVVIFDLDNFKKKNDMYGHPAGDRILVEVSRILQENIRNEDILVRYGGDEFLFIFWNINGEEVKLITKRIKQEILDRTGCYISEGVATGCIEKKEDFLDLIIQADDDLYDKKVK